MRRALKTCGPATAGEIAARLHIKESDIDRILAALEGDGGIFRGHFTRADAIQWCDRYNLERIHRMTLARVRAEIEPCADHEYAAFRLRWMRVGGAELPADQSGVAAVLEQLSGIAATPEIWEHAIIPARIAGYRPEMLDLVCMSGRMKWVAVAEEGIEGARPASTPSRVTFIARKASLFVPREAPAPSDAKEQAVLEALGAAGAQYLDEVAERANVSERDALSALWRMAAAGRVSNDNFAPIRMFADDRGAERALESVARRPATRHDAAVRARLKSSLAGRWSLIRAGEHRAGGPDDTRDLALKLLERHGILAREMLGLESTQISWNEIAFALRRLEYSGAIRRGWFVRSISGEQYALPEAVEMLRAVRSLIPAREKPVALSAIDPANPYGAVIAGMRYRARGGQRRGHSRRPRDCGIAGTRDDHGGRGRRRRREFQRGGGGSSGAEAAYHDRFNRRRGGARIAAGRHSGRDAIPFRRTLAGLRRTAWPGARARIAPQRRPRLERHRLPQVGQLIGRARAVF